jgi:prolyl oligopeptidase
MTFQIILALSIFCLMPDSLSLAFSSSDTFSGIYSSEKNEILGMPLTDDERSYVDAQNDRTHSFLNTLSGHLIKQISDRSLELLPGNALVKENYFGFDHMIKRQGLVRILDDGAEVTLIPSSILPQDASFVAYTISPDQSKALFAYSFFGSDWQTWQIFDLKNQKIIKSSGTITIKNLNGVGGLAWTPDSLSIIYPHWEQIQDDFKGVRDPKLMLHKIGTSRSSDRVIFRDLDRPATAFWSAQALTNSYAIVYRRQGVAVVPSAAFLVNLENGKATPVGPVYKFLGNTPGPGIVGLHKQKVYFRTAELGSNFGVLEIDLSNPQSRPTRRIILPSHPSAVLYQAVLVGDKILAQYFQRDLSLSIEMYDLKGRRLARLLPTQYGISDYSMPSVPLTNADASSKKAYFSLSSVGSAPVTFVADVVAGTFMKLPELRKVPFNKNKVTMERVNYQSHDGQIIPMFIFRRNDRPSRPATFAYLFSYGFIGIPNLPQWNRKFQLALELGAIVAIPQIRGGGEFGANWQEAGTLKRENTFLDLVYASRWLKKHENILDRRVVAVGRSFGGMSGAVHFVHHQHEFDAISSIVPVTDWAKHFSGAGWWMGDDFGILRGADGKIQSHSIPELIRRNNRWSPSENISKLSGKKLIPTIFFSGQFDTNTTPHQTFRFMKKLERFGKDQPVYMFQHSKGGHTVRAELVDEFLFLAKVFSLNEFLPLR